MIKIKVTVTQALLHEWFYYDPETGLFAWRKRPIKSTISIGTVAGSIAKQHQGLRRVIWLQGKRIYASRAAYIYVHGDLPDTVLVDHIDGDALNDRIANLRLASTAQNTWNRLQKKGSRYKLGVCKNIRGRFYAQIQMPTGKKLHLGTWANEGEAHAAYMGAAAILHSEFWIGHREVA